MAENAVASLPPGFVLETPAGAPGLPPGFMLETSVEPSTAAGEGVAGKAGTDEPNKGSVQQIVPTGGTALDMARGFASGFRKGVAAIPGVPGSMESLGRAAINRIFGPGTVPPETALPTSADTIERQTSFNPSMPNVPYYQPMTRPGRYAETIGEFAPAAAIPAGAPTRGGELVARALSNTTLPAVASEYVGQRLEGSPYEGAGRVAAALLTPYAPRAALRAVTPLPAPAYRTAAADALAAEGVDLTAGQRAGQSMGGRTLRYAESMAAESPLGSSNIAGTLENQQQQFTRAAMRRIDPNVGPDALADPLWLRDQRARIGADFDRITSHPLPLNTTTRGQIATELGDAFRDYLNTVPNSAQRPFVEGFLNDVLNAMAPGGTHRLPRQIDGETIQAWRSRLGRMASETNDPEFGSFLRSARDTLDDIYGAHLPPGEAAAWTEARRQWAHLVTLEDAAASAGPNGAFGIVTPQMLAAASRSGQRGRYAEALSPYSDLAHQGGGVMDPLPNSGTPARLGVAQPNVTNLIVGGVTGRIVGSEPMQGYLGNQLLAGPLNAMGRTRPGMVARALMLPAEMSDTVNGR